MISSNKDKVLSFNPSASGGTDRQPEETMREAVMKIEELGGIEKVRINMIKYSCSCENDLTEILLGDISGDISLNIKNDVDKSTKINLIYHELSYKQIKDSAVKEVKDDFELSRKRLGRDHYMHQSARLYDV